MADIGVVDFDLEAIRKLNFILDCHRCRSSRSCCNGMDVEITGEESLAIAGRLDELRGADCPVEEVLDGRRLFEPLAGNMFRIRQKPDGDCTFVTGNLSGCSCVIHQIEEKLGTKGVKPRVCRLWPLCVEQRNDRDVLTVDEQCYGYQCCEKVENGRAPDYGSVLAIVEGVFGRERAEALCRLLAAGG